MGKWPGQDFFDFCAIDGYCLPEPDKYRQVKGLITISEDHQRNSSTFAHGNKYTLYLAPDLRHTRAQWLLSSEIRVKVSIKMPIPWIVPPDGQ
jgi:hypothetical protein